MDAQADDERAVEHTTRKADSQRDDEAKQLVGQTQPFRETLSKVRSLATELELVPPSHPRHAEVKAALAKADRAKLVAMAKRLRLPLRGTLGFEKAEVTAGGVSLDEVDSRTMQSKKQPGLYFAGEVLDLDGWIGGYNFQSAWSTGWRKTTPIPASSRTATRVAASSAPSRSPGRTRWRSARAARISSP